MQAVANRAGVWYNRAKRKGPRDGAERRSAMHNELTQKDLQLMR